MRAGLIVLMCVFAACLYGVLHDQVTARVCVEYFTVGHDPDVIPTDDPTLLGLGWGVLATWWVGLILGLALAVAARAGRRPPRTVRSLVRPVVRLLVVTAVFAAAAGVLGYVAGRSGMIVLPEPLTDKLPKEKWAAFQADAFAHTASYWVGFVGGGLLITTVWLSRRHIRPVTARR